MARASGPGTCRHCGEKKYLKARGVCHQCYYTPGVLALYPSTSKFKSRGRPDFNGRAAVPEPTAHLNGTAEKELVLAGRAARGEALHHPLDARPDVA